MADPLLRYVVLRHEGVADPHFDLMLELVEGDALATWRCPAWPLTKRVRVTRLADHRREYLTYEGPVSGDRGRVSRVEAGTYQMKRDPEFNSVARWSWGVFWPNEESPDGGVLLRRWLDSKGQEQWDAAPM